MLSQHRNDWPVAAAQRSGSTSTHHHLRPLLRLASIFAELIESGTADLYLQLFLCFAQIVPQTRASHDHNLSRRGTYPFDAHHDSRWLHTTWSSSGRIYSSYPCQAHCATTQSPLQRAEDPWILEARETSPRAEARREWFLWGRCSSRCAFY